MSPEEANTSLDGKKDMLTDLSLKEIIDGCQQKIENQCFELFRRAFDEKNEQAKTAVYYQYRRLVFDWAHKALAGYPLTEQDVEDITSQAMVKFFRHLTRVSVADRYEHVAQILGYCKKCVKTSAIDFTRKAMRAKRNKEEWIDKVLERKASFPSPEKEVEREQLRQEIRAFANKHLDETEKLYIELKFEHGLTPRQMVEMYPKEFPNAREVYKIWDRVKKRLRPLFKIYLK